MANDAYKVLQAVTIPKAVTKLEDDVDGNPRYSTRGVLYTEGSYVRASDISPPLRERAEKGEFEGTLEPVSASELEEVEREIARAGQFSTFAPEHEVERVTLANYGHDVLSRKQILEMNSAGSDAAKDAQEAAKEGGADERPAITEASTFAEVDSLADASREGKVVGAGGREDEPDIDPESDSLQTMPSGVVGGANLIAAEGGEVKEKSAKASRKKPGQSNDKASAPAPAKSDGDDK